MPEAEIAQPEIDDDSFSDEELDARDEAAEAKLRAGMSGDPLPLRIVDDAWLKDQREKSARRVADKMALAKSLREGDLATAARLYGLKSPMPLRQAAPANDNSPYPGIVSSADFVRGFVPPDYHVDGVAQAGFLYALTAGTGTGKTAVLLALTAATALGTSLCGRQVRKGRVVYFAGENPDDVRMRWLAMAHHVGFGPAAVDVHFIAGTFSIPGAIARITADVERLGGADMIVVDTSAAYFQGDDENGNTPLGKHARDLRALTELPGKPAVFVACHPTKNADQTNLQPRGGGAFIAEVDGNLTLTKADSRVKLHWQVKHRGADFAPLYFALEPVTAPVLVDTKGRPVPTVMASGMADWVPKPDKPAKSDAWNGALAILQERGPMGEHEWCAAYIALEPEASAESVARRFRRHRARLLELEKVVLEGDLFRVPDAAPDMSGHVQTNVQ